MSIWSQFISVILPPRCALTGEIVDHPGMISPRAWGRVTFITPPCCHHCGVPFDINDGDEIPNLDYMKCGACLADEPVYNQSRSAVIYDDQSRELLLLFKHGDQTHLTVTFAPWLNTVLNQQDWAIDFILPVPLHWTRLLKRRYNQSALLAKSLSKLTEIPALLNILKRGRATKSQGHLSAKDRQANVKNAFHISVNDVPLIRDKNILLIDDVLTTGSTINECARVLRESGAKNIYVLTVARAVRDGMAA